MMELNLAAAILRDIGYHAGITSKERSACLIGEKCVKSVMDLNAKAADPKATVTKERALEILRAWTKSPLVDAELSASFQIGADAIARELLG